MKKGLYLILFFISMALLRVGEIKREQAIFNEWASEQRAIDSFEYIASLDEVESDVLEATELTEDDLNEIDYYGELEELAILVMAEAGNQDLYGKRLVVDVVLNRVDADEFPDTIHDVIYQKNQFSTITDGAFDRACWSVTDECFEAVKMELEARADYKIKYFTAGRYNKYCTPAYIYGDHYFGY